MNDGAYYKFNYSVAYYYMRGRNIKSLYTWSNKKYTFQTILFLRPHLF